MRSATCSSAIRMACVEIRTNASSPRSQRPYTVAVEVRSRAATSFTVSRRGHALPVPKPRITGALTFERMLATSDESIPRAGSGFPRSRERLLGSADCDSWSMRDWGASGRWFKSSRPDHLKAAASFGKPAALRPSLFGVPAGLTTGSPWPAPSLLLTTRSAGDVIGGANVSARSTAARSSRGGSERHASRRRGLAAARGPSGPGAAPRLWATAPTRSAES